MKSILYTDGGSRGNPGPAAIGGILKDARGALIGEFSETIGVATNNQAEYQALIHGLILAQEHQVQELSCYLDSELVVKQLTGIYRIKDRDLQIHADTIRSLAVQFKSTSFFHIPREQNGRADALVNAALDNEG
jgi:ribonuclease HI